jgi:hypothetical protein
VTEFDSPVQDQQEEYSRVQLWPGDPGGLPLDVRRTLVALLRGPFLSQQRTPELWSALLAHEEVVRRHLADLLLELALDADAEVAFTRNIEPPPDAEVSVPSVLRAVTLTFIDSALLLHLRHLLLQASAQEERAVVGRDELDAHMHAYAASSGNDEARFDNRLLASINKMIKWSLLLPTDTEQRWEISSVLALILTADEIGGIEAEYERLRDGFDVADDALGARSTRAGGPGAQDGAAEDRADDASDDQDAAGEGTSGDVADDEENAR